MPNENLSTPVMAQGTKKRAELTRETRMKQLAALSKGISHPVRAEIIRMLYLKPQDERCTCSDIVDSFPLAQSSISQHLKVLKDSGWILGEIDGPRVCYCIVEGIIDHYTALTDYCLKIK